ncbi:helix-turn-helix domain-containing protein [Bdellovibrio sp. HCB290]|uniref:helix-turn-helix domain-containing protein n=1 Tax=Bdellovibrio sp. HCB290 TaxID=3394356 RepID=UPI0039B43875
MRKATLGDYLKTTREAAGLTQADVSNALGYSTPQFISNWERSLSAPPVNAIKRLGQLYKIDANEMFEVILQAEIEATTADLRRKFKSAR